MIPKNGIANGIDQNGCTRSVIDYFLVDQEAEWQNWYPRVFSAKPCG